MQDLAQIIETLDFTIIVAIIDKCRLIHTYTTPSNPYDLALRFCMERFFRFLRERDEHNKTTHIIFEQRGRREDRSLRDTFQRICRGASYCGLMPGFIPVFANKQSNSTGLQLADLTARPIGVHFLRPNQPNKAYDIIRTKLRQDHKGRAEGWGVKMSNGQSMFWIFIDARRLYPFQCERGYPYRRIVESLL